MGWKAEKSFRKNLYASLFGKTREDYTFSVHVCAYVQNFQRYIRQV
jgi:hypothetical protein